MIDVAYIKGIEIEQMKMKSKSKMEAEQKRKEMVSNVKRARGVKG